MGKAFPIVVGNGEMSFEKGQIESWILEGWAFRVKEIHGKRYMTRRKGKLERSLGPFSEGKWRQISNLKAKVKEKPAKPAAFTDEHLTTLSQLKKRVDGIEGLLKRLEKESLDTKRKLEVRVDLLRDSALRRVRDDHYGCIHMGKDGYCTWWYYDERLLRHEQKEDSVTESGILKKVWRDNVKANPEICSSCPSYNPRIPQTKTSS
jgi:hypothetical protein